MLCGGTQAIPSGGSFPVSSMTVRFQGGLGAVAAHSQGSFPRTACWHRAVPAVLLETPLWWTRSAGGGSRSLVIYLGEKAKKTASREREDVVFQKTTQSSSF